MKEARSQKSEVRTNDFCAFVPLCLCAFVPFLMAFAPFSVSAQAPLPVGDEMLSNSAMGEVAVPLANLWDGVDKDNNLCVPVMRGLVLNDVGKMVDTPLPSYPNFIDMNDDGLPDLVVADTQGFVWIYANSGEKGKPKFTAGKFVPTFIGWVSRIYVCDWDGDGDNDIVVGTFYGDVVILENFGSKKEWRFTRKMGVPRYVDPQFTVDDPQERLRQIMIGKMPLIKGNYLAPWVCDWNKDGKPDLLLGEGTYSANSVRLFVNTGSRMKPVFSEDREFYLAYGEGFEQLTPSVVDYNGDGLDDLIVGTRTGHIRLHKGTKAAVEEKDFIAAMKGNLAPAILEYESNLNIGGREIFDKMSVVYPCDWNEDGLFDLVLGHTSGRVYIALNKGSKANPDFPSAEPVKGADVEKDLLAPDDWMNGVIRVWWHNFIGGFCNTASLLTCEKEVMLKPSGSPLAVPIRPVTGNYFLYYRYVNDYQGWMRNQLAYVKDIPGVNTENVVGGRLITPNQSFPLRLGKKYELSFSSILQGKPALWKVWTHEPTAPPSDIAPPPLVIQEASGIIPPSSSWVKRNYKFKCPSVFQTNYNYRLIFRMPPGDCQFLLDGISLKEIP
ncbi:MAG: VCBS repeat-containing protein [Kiritimatiellae bacterium]|nr:VCBS repeat-containing protein [Kiritimatiellia bacterium]